MSFEYHTNLETKNNQETGGVKLDILKNNERYLQDLKDFGITETKLINQVLGIKKIISFDIEDENNIEIVYYDGENICVERQKIKRTNPETNAPVEEDTFRIINSRKQFIRERNFEEEKSGEEPHRRRKGGRRYEGNLGVYNKDD